MNLIGLGILEVGYGRVIYYVTVISANSNFSFLVYHFKAVSRRVVIKFNGFAM